jgi:hypothetical protein
VGSPTQKIMLYKTTLRTNPGHHCIVKPRLALNAHFRNGNAVRTPNRTLLGHMQQGWRTIGANDLHAKPEVRIAVSSHFLEHFR